VTPRPPAEEIADPWEEWGGRIGAVIGAGLAWLACHYWLFPLLSPIFGWRHHR
jgi:hypothetical protein